MRLVTGSGSPVGIDSSSELLPSVILPSTGTFSPGRTRSKSPTFTSASATSVSLPSAAMRRAVFGLRLAASQHREQRPEQGDRDHRRHEARRQEPVYRFRKAERREQPPARAPATMQMLAQVEQFGRRGVDSVRER